MMHPISKFTAATVAIGVFAGLAQAGPVWHFPYKGAPYAVPHDHQDRLNEKLRLKSLTQKESQRVVR